MLLTFSSDHKSFPAFRRVVAGLAYSFLALAAIAAYAQGPKPALPRKEQPQPPKGVTIPTTSHALTADDLDAFFGGLMPVQLPVEFGLKVFDEIAGIQSQHFADTN